MRETYRMAGMACILPSYEAVITKSGPGASLRQVKPRKLVISTDGQHLIYDNVVALRKRGPHDCLFCKSGEVQD